VRRSDVSSFGANADVARARSIGYPVSRLKPDYKDMRRLQFLLPRIRCVRFAGGLTGPFEEPLEVVPQRSIVRGPYMDVIVVLARLCQQAA